MPARPDPTATNAGGEPLLTPTPALAPLPAEAPAANHSEQLLAEVAALPPLPGVYRYFDATGAV